MVPCVAGKVVTGPPLIVVTGAGSLVVDPMETGMLTPVGWIVTGAAELVIEMDGMVVTAAPAYVADAAGSNPPLNE